ncbi:retrovirus-related pol polyprotein from transposon TNT 1-94 [Tanacetum coccineum]|uniref:Retrovirus-related pol polyprotein from transposon TNT 1-94 n=1 Tax=Tanacetum coccineum TaxID=301880 RepID=A0ABQ5IJ40_9ASTR
MNIINMSMRPVQVNTKFLNSLPPEWSKFVTDVKLDRDLHTTNYDQFLAVLVFTQGDDPNACLNKAMAFLSAVAASRVTVQQVQERQGQSYVGTGNKGNATSSKGNNAGRQTRVVKCYNCQGEGHMARQCTQPKRPRNVAWFKDKAILAKTQESCQILDEEQLAFLADLGIPDGGSDGQSFQLWFRRYLRETHQEAVQSTNLYTQQDSMILSVIEQMSEQIINHVNNSEKANQKAQRIKPTLYDGSVISNQHAVIPVIDEEETLILEELNQLFEDFGKRFVPQQEFSAKQAFWLHTSNPNTEKSDILPIIIEAPSELPKITPDAITGGEWGFEHTKSVFLNDIIPFYRP